MLYLREDEVIKAVTIDCCDIRDWDTFHSAFEKAFGFPGWYGRNSNAWIDIMTNLDEWGYSDFEISHGEMVLLQLANASALKRAAPEILVDTLEMAAFCNWRRAEVGRSPYLIVSCYA